MTPRIVTLGCSWGIVTLGCSGKRGWSQKGYSNWDKTRAEQGHPVKDTAQAHPSATWEEGWHQSPP